MHARMAQSNGHPEAAWDEKARRFDAIPLDAHRAIRELARQAGLRARARGPWGPAASPSHALQAQWLLMQCRIAYRCGGSAGIARISRSPASRAPDEGRTLGRRRGNCQRAQVQAYTIRP